MKTTRLATAFGFALLAASTFVQAQGKPSGVPPSNPPATLIEIVCSYLPSLPFCD